MKQAQANYNVTQNQTSYNQLIANKNGVITERNIEIGQVISAGQPAFQLAISGDREVVIGVPEQAIAQIKVGQDAIVTLWSKPDERFAAYVREISPAADQSRTFSVKVALREGQNTIQLGQSARVFFSSTESNVLSVPLASVSAAGKNAYVWVVNADNSIRKVPVSVGEYGRDSVTIRSGLQPKDYVVVGGVHLLREKQKIQPISRDNKTVKIADRRLSMNYNLSEWALKNKGLVLYLMLLLGIVGVVSSSKLAQSEDPPFTFKVMVVQTYWPGATAREVSEQVTDRIEKELMTTGKYERHYGLLQTRRVDGDFCGTRCHALQRDTGCVGMTYARRLETSNISCPMGYKDHSLMMSLAILSATFMC